MSRPERIGETLPRTTPTRLPPITWQCDVCEAYKDAPWDRAPACDGPECNGRLMRVYRSKDVVVVHRRPLAHRELPDLDMPDEVGT